MMKTNFFLAIILGLSGLSAEAVSGESMDLAVSGWGGWMRGSVVVNGQKAKIHRDAMNYFEDIDFAGSLELVIKNSSMAMLGSVDYVENMSSDVTVSGQAGTLESSEIVGCIAVGYPLAAGNSSMDFFIGLQTLQMDNKLKLNGVASESDSDEVYDAVVILRYKQELFSNFYLNLPLSIGGGYLSDSEFIYDAGLQLLYQFGDSFDVRAGYRITGYDFSEDSGYSDFYQQGYTLGLGLTF